MRVEIDGDWNRVGGELSVKTQFLCILQNRVEL